MGLRWQMKWVNETDLSQLSFIDHFEKNVIFKVNNPGGATIQFKSSKNKGNGFRYQAPNASTVMVDSLIESWTSVDLPDGTIFGFVSGGGIKYDLILSANQTTGRGGSYSITSDETYSYNSIVAHENGHGGAGETNPTNYNGADGIQINIDGNNYYYGGGGGGVD